MKFYSYIIFCFLLQPFLLSAQECSLFKVVSQDPKTGVSVFGNAFAVSSTLLVVNDHTLAQDAEKVDLQSGNKSIKGKIIKRDFHTDLALIEIGANEGIIPCQLSSEESELNENLQIRGFEKEDKNPSTSRATIKNSKSDKLEVPGIEESIELVGSGNDLALRGSQSGSVVINGKKVVAMLTQKTPEGSGLAIPAPKIAEILKKMRSNQLPQLPYKYNYRDGSFEFKGLKLTGQGQNPMCGISSGNPHENCRIKSGNPHEGKAAVNPFKASKAGNKPIALEDYDLGFAVASVDDFRELRLQLPAIAEALKASNTSRVFIASIDGMKTNSLFSFIRALGKCQTCTIDSFWVESADPAQLENNSIQILGYFTSLIVSMEKNHSQAEIRPLVELISPLNYTVVDISRQAQLGINNTSLMLKAQNQWAAIELKLAKYWHSEETLDILNEIRTRLK